MSSRVRQNPDFEAVTRSPLVGELDAFLDGWIAARPMPVNLRDAIVYALHGGGKRVRPLLTLHACEAVGGEASSAIAPAAAVELVHTFSLVHDDLPAMDDDDLRRGRPTLHKQAGETLAILAGDAMSSLALELIASEVDSAELAGRLCRELSSATVDMIAGQTLDTVPETSSATSPDRKGDLERLQGIHRTKTGALIRCSCRMGALCGTAGGTADTATLAAITSCAEALGLMFQVVDDILDVTQTTEHLGKKTRKDEEKGKLTFPGVLGLDGSRAEVTRLRDAALGALEPLGAPAQHLRDWCEWLAVRTR